MASVTFEDAIRRAVESYWRGVEPEKMAKLGEKKPKYSKKYFDRFESDKFEGKTTSKDIENGKWS